MRKTVPFSMRLDPELKAKLQELADKDRRSLTNFIEVKLWEIVGRAEQAEKKKR